MRSSRLLCQWLKSMPGKGIGIATTAKSGQPLLAAQEQQPHADVSLIRMIGIVKKPQLMHQGDERTWSCRLLVTQVGASAMDPEATTQLVVCQEQYNLKCKGEEWFEFCKHSIRSDSVVFINAKAVQRPKFVAAHSLYAYDTELHVTPQLGWISLIARL